jgi:hypothetical protein
MIPVSGKIYKRLPCGRIMLPLRFKIFTDAEVPATITFSHQPYTPGRMAMAQWEEQIKTLEKRIEAIRGYL